MVETYTISNLLSSFKDFDKAFWTTYSIDFNAIDFVLKKDLKTIMSSCYFHLICDPSKLDESLAIVEESGKKLQKVVGLQEYCTISIQPTEGAFHPKIMLFTSTSEILVIVSSANATTSGILSNQDLAGMFVYRAGDELNKQEVASIYGYLKTFDGWCDEAKADFDLLSKRFEFLDEIETSDKILTIPNRIGLLEQIENQIKNKTDVKEVRIFSPFFDDHFAGISQIGQKFEVPVCVYSPIEKYEAILPNKLPNSVRFFSTDNLSKKIFHAKFFEFVLKDKSIVFWGSANCSYSGLISPDRNYEILIKQHMSFENVFSIWGDLSNSKEKEVDYLSNTPEDETPEDKPKERILLLGGRYENENEKFIIKFKGSFNGIDKFRLIGINTRNEKLKIDVVGHSDTEISVPYNPKLVIVFIEFKAERFSNLLFVNNPFAIAARLKGREKDKENWKTPTGNLNLKYLFSRFNTETGVKKKTSGTNKSFITGFWKLPDYFRGHHGGGVINLDDFIRKRTSKFKGIKDEEGDGQDQTGRKKSKNKKPGISNPQPDELTIRQQSKRLLNNIKILQSEGGFNKINQKRWLDALFRLLHYILSDFEEVEKIKVDAVERVIEMLNSVSRISVWMATSFDIKLLKDRHIEILRCVLDIYKVLTLYQYARFLQYNFFDPYDKKSVELFTSAKRGFFYSNIIEEEFFERIKFSEHNFLSVEDLVSKLPNKKQAYKIFSGFQNKMWHSFKDVVEQSKVHSRKTKNGRQWLMRLRSTNQAYHLEELLGHDVVVSKKRK